MVAINKNTQPMSGGRGVHGTVTLARLSEANAELIKLSGSDPCGHLCWQQVPGDAMIDHNALDSLCDGVKLPDVHRLREVRQRTAFKRAMKDLKRLLPDKHETRIVNDGEDEVVYEIVEIMGDEKAGKNSYTWKESLVLDLATGVVSSANCSPAFTSMHHQALAGFLNHRSHNATDLRNMVLVFLRKKGVMLSNGSGIYFVPHTPAIVAVLDAMQAILRDPSIAGSIAVLAQPNTDATRKVLQGSAQAGIEEEIRQIEHRLNVIDTDKLRDSTFGKKVVELDALKGKARLMADVLKFKADGIEARLNGVVAAFKAKVEKMSPLDKAHPDYKAPDPDGTAGMALPTPAEKAIEAEDNAVLNVPLVKTASQVGISSEAHEAALALLEEAGVTPGEAVSAGTGLSPADAMDDDCGF